MNDDAKVSREKCSKIVNSKKVSFENKNAKR